MPSSESFPLLVTQAATDDNETTTFEEYGAIGVAVIKDASHEALIVHDFAGPIFLEAEAMERKLSFAETLNSERPELPPHDVADSKGEATIASEVSTMAKNIIGCGVLSLSGGLAQAANSPPAVYAGNFWILVLGAIFGYFCYLIAKVCDMTGRTTYRGIWQETIGSRGGTAISLANALKAGLSDLAYASILADTTKSLVTSFFGINLSRTLCLIVITIVAILPLCLLKNLHVLAPFSVIGTAGVFLTAAAMAVRYFDGSYLDGGKFFQDISSDMQPSFGTRNDAWKLSILPFICMTYEAYVMVSSV
jgi:amino acid permease